MAEKVITELLAIEEHQRIRQTSSEVFAAVKVQQGWSTGKQVSEREYLNAIVTFLKSPMRGGK